MPSCLAICASGRESVISHASAASRPALLAYLAYHRHQSYSRQSLIEIFWPESEPQTGRYNLSNALSSLRNPLEPPGVPGGSVIIAERFSVELNAEAVTTDVAAFEQALRTGRRVTCMPPPPPEPSEQYLAFLIRSLIG